MTRKRFHEVDAEEQSRRRAAADHFAPWGVVDEVQGQIYVPRPADEQYWQLAVVEGRDCNVLGPRQSGKSSLINHAQTRIVNDSAMNMRLAIVDVGGRSPTPGIAAEGWIHRVVKELCFSMKREDLGQQLIGVSSLTLVDALRVLAAEDDSPLLVVLDEFDKLEHFPSFAGEVMAQIRAAQQLRVRDTQLAKIILTLVGVKPPALICAETTSPGGAKEIGGESLWLEDFSHDAETIDAIAKGFVGRPPGESRELARVAFRFSAGYPHACMWTCRTIVLEDYENSPDLEDELRKKVISLKRRPPDFLNVTQTYLIGEHPQWAAAALTTYLQVLNRVSVPFDGRDPVRSVLEWSGLCRVSSEGEMRPRGPLTERHFDRVWTQERLDTLRASIVPALTHHPRTDKRIAILTTGGTIGMVEFPDGSVRAPEDPRRLPYEEVGKIAEFELEEVFPPVDSANVGPREWTAIATMITRLMQEEEPKPFDGFVVTHGTDTLAHTASAVAFALGPKLKVPVVFTGSQTTVDVEHGDARSNLLRACHVAVADDPRPIPEVVICFGEYILRACRAQKKDDRRFDAFESPAYPPLGYVAETVYLLPQNFRDDKVPVPPGPIDLKADFADGILVVAQTPGSFGCLYEEGLELKDDTGRHLCRAVVIQSLGAGNIPTRKAYDLQPLIAKAVSYDIPVVLTGQYPVHARNVTRYSPSLAAVGAGAIPTGNMTIAAVVAKLAWVLADVDRKAEAGQVSVGARRAEVARRMQANEIGEVGDIVVEGSRV